MSRPALTEREEAETIENRQQLMELTQYAKYPKWRDILITILLPLVIVLTVAAPVYVSSQDAKRTQALLDQHIKQVAVNAQILHELQAAIAAGPDGQRTAVIVNLQATSCMLRIEPQDRTIDNVGACVDKAIKELKRATNDDGP